MRFGVQGSGFGVCGVGFRVWGLGLGLRVGVLGFRRSHHTFSLSSSWSVLVSSEFENGTHKVVKAGFWPCLEIFLMRTS